jgi:hypothetical protein
MHWFFRAALISSGRMVDLRHRWRPESPPLLAPKLTAARGSDDDQVPRRHMKLDTARSAGKPSSSHQGIEEADVGRAASRRTLQTSIDAQGLRTVPV